MTLGFKGPSWYWDIKAWVFSFDARWSPTRLTVLGVELCWGYSQPFDPDAPHFKLGEWS